MKTDHDHHLAVLERQLNNEDSARAHQLSDISPVRRRRDRRGMDTAIGVMVLFAAFGLMFRIPEVVLTFAVAAIVLTFVRRSRSGPKGPTKTMAGEPSATRAQQSPHRRPLLVLLTSLSAALLIAVALLAGASGLAAGILVVVGTWLVRYRRHPG